MRRASALAAGPPAGRDARSTPGLTVCTLRDPRRTGPYAACLLGGVGDQPVRGGYDLKLAGDPSGLGGVGLSPVPRDSKDKACASTGRAGSTSVPWPPRRPARQPVSGRAPGHTCPGRTPARRRSTSSVNWHTGRQVMPCQAPRTGRPRTMRTSTPGARLGPAAACPCDRHVKISTSCREPRGRLATGKRKKRSPPASPVPGWSSGDVWTAERGGSVAEGIEEYGQSCKTQPRGGC